MTTQKRDADETTASKPRTKAPLKELRDIMNMTKVKMPLGEMSYLGDIASLIPKSTTAFSGKHMNFIPEGPHKPVIGRGQSHEQKEGEGRTKQGSMRNTKENMHTSGGNGQVNKPIIPQTSAQQSKKGLSIRIPESSPKAQQIKLFQFKSLSTKHGNPSEIAEQQISVLPLQPACNIVIPNYEPAKCSLKRNGVVRAYAASTNQGLVRYVNNSPLINQ